MNILICAALLDPFIYHHDQYATINLFRNQLRGEGYEKSWLDSGMSGYKFLDTLISILISKKVTLIYPIFKLIKTLKPTEIMHLLNVTP